MPPLAIAFALTAALLHATWNLLLARAPDTNAALAVAMLVGALLLLPLAIADWRLEPEGVPLVAFSSVLELAYFWMLARAYRRADLSLVYPIARGLAPVLVLVASVLILGQRLPVASAVGVVLVAVGVVLVRGLRSPASWPDVAMAVGIAGLIAAYTLVDQRGVGYANPITYVVLVVGIPALVYAGVLAARGGAARMRAAATPPVVAGGVAVVAAYGLVLAALAIAAAAEVAALRETSIVMATILAAVVLKEKVERSRWLGSVVVVGGIALVVLA
jgi:drug/metabolite transporter (DMT)-like permease